MPSPKKKVEDSDKSVRETNFDNARETARVNHEKHVEQNVSDGNEGVEVREAHPVEVINPVRNGSTGELEDDTRTIKSTPEEEVGADTKTDTKTDESK